MIEAIIYLENSDFTISDDLKNHIAEEIADNLVILKQFQYYYKISQKQINKLMNYKIERQMKRIANDIK